MDTTHASSDTLVVCIPVRLVVCMLRHTSPLPDSMQTAGGLQAARPCVHMRVMLRMDGDL
jgi:hypothetical protein